MGKVTVRLHLKKLEGLNAKDIANRKFQNKLGREVVGMVKDAVGVGLSPVKGEGRFPGYAADRIDKRKYPNSVKKRYPNKQRRPVNLELSGDMLDAFKFKGIIGGVRLGMISASRRLKTIFKAHNATNDSKRPFPRRAVIPDAKGEEFSPKIMRRIKEIYLQRIREMIGK